MSSKNLVFTDGPLESLQRIKIFLGQCSVSRDVRLKHESGILLESVNWEVVERLLSIAKSQNLEGKNLVFLIATYGDVPISNIFSNKRDQKTATVRNVSFYFLRKYSRMSFPEIGRMMSRDHSTVQSGVRRIQDMLDTLDPTVTDLVAQIKIVIAVGKVPKKD